MDKKGGEFLGEHVINIIIGLLVIAILSFLIVKGVLFWSEGNDLNKAGEVLEEIVSKIKVVNSENVEGRIVVFPPVNWYLRGFPNYDFPIGECFKAKDCLCICKDVECSGDKKCKGFDFDFEIDGEISKVVGGNVAGAAIKRYEGLKLDSSEEIIIIKEGLIKIRMSENGV